VGPVALGDKGLPFGARARLQRGAALLGPAAAAAAAAGAVLARDAHLSFFNILINTNLVKHTLI